MKIFVSYRRADTADVAARLSDRLRQEFGDSQVFMDIVDIEVGDSFPARIEQALAESDAFLVLIGQSWVGEREDGTSRIQEDGDFVRAEVRQALVSQKRTIPVLVHGATMPSAEALPEDVRRLPSLNACSVRHTEFERDAAHLVNVLRGRKAAGAGRTPVATRVLRMGLGLVAAAALALVVGVIHNLLFHRALSVSLGGDGPAGLFVVFQLMAGVVFGARWRR